MNEIFLVGVIARFRFDLIFGGMFVFCHEGFVLSQDYLLDTFLISTASRTTTIRPITVHTHIPAPAPPIHPQPIHPP